MHLRKHLTDFFQAPASVLSIAGTYAVAQFSAVAALHFSGDELSDLEKMLLYIGPCAVGAAYAGLFAIGKSFLRENATIESSPIPELVKRDTALSLTPLPSRKHIAAPLIGLATGTTLAGIGISTPGTLFGATTAYSLANYLRKPSRHHALIAASFLTGTSTSFLLQGAPQGANYILGASTALLPYPVLATVLQFAQAGLPTIELPKTFKEFSTPTPKEKFQDTDATGAALRGLYRAEHFSPRADQLFIDTRDVIESPLASLEPLREFTTRLELVPYQIETWINRTFSPRNPQYDVQAAVLARIQGDQELATAHLRRASQKARHHGHALRDQVLITECLVTGQWDDTLKELLSEQDMPVEALGTSSSTVVTYDSTSSPFLSKVFVIKQGTQKDTLDEYVSTRKIETLLGTDPGRQTVEFLYLLKADHDRLWMATARYEQGMPLLHSADHYQVEATGYLSFLLDSLRVEGEARDIERVLDERFAHPLFDQVRSELCQTLTYFHERARDSEAHVDLDSHQGQWLVTEQNRVLRLDIQTRRGNVQLAYQLGKQLGSHPRALVYGALRRECLDRFTAENGMIKPTAQSIDAAVVPIALNAHYWSAQGQGEKELTAHFFANADTLLEQGVERHHWKREPVRRMRSALHVLRETSSQLSNQNSHERTAQSYSTQ